MTQDRRIHHWICTGEHIIPADYKVSGAVPHSETLEDADSVSDSDGGSSDSSNLPDKLLGVDDDILIPSAAEINRVYCEGQATWAHFVALAGSLPQLTFPPGVSDPSITLKDVPALPNSIPKSGILYGRPLWHIPDPEYEIGQDQDFDLRYMLGIQKHYAVSYPKPIECRLFSQSNAPNPGHDTHSDGSHSDLLSGLPLLTLCWSYIISVRFLELQGRKVRYTRDSLQPKSSKTLHQRRWRQRQEVVLDLGPSASHDLVRWLCAILAPKPGWVSDGKSFAPWAAFCSGEPRFVICTDKPVTFSPDTSPPNSGRASELLIELCSLYGFESEMESRRTGLTPATAGFLAALALPFYRYVKLQPQFPVPVIRRQKIGDATSFKAIRQHVTDLQYYMTLSMHPRTLGSIIWSVFWQPDIECNLVSPWLSSILHAIKPIIESRDLVKLAKVFALRRPRVALWWLGISFLGDTTILDWITRYLETLEERWGFGSMGPPDQVGAVWTGSPQSFLDDRSHHSYPHPTDPVPRADLLRHRHNFLLQDSAARLLAWRPFGFVEKKSIELDLWPWLEQGHVRDYVHWVWCTKSTSGYAHDEQLGFRKDTGRFIENVPDRLGFITAANASTGPTGHGLDLALAPSQESTLQMIFHCTRDITGDMDNNLVVVGGAKSHPWLKHWRGLE